MGKAAKAKETADAGIVAGLAILHANAHQEGGRMGNREEERDSTPKGENTPREEEKEDQREDASSAADRTMRWNVG